MPTTGSGKAIASRNATTHGLFSRDVVLPALGEDPAGYTLLEAEWMKQLPPRTLLERHYVEKIAAASWRLRRLHRWQAQLFEDPTLTETERLDRLEKVMRHETALQRQIDTSVKMLSKDAPLLYASRAKDAVLDSTQTAQREYDTNEEDAVHVELKVQERLRCVREATEAAAVSLADAPLDPVAVQPETADESEICRNELQAILKSPFRLTEYLEPGHRHHPEPRVFKLNGHRCRK